MQRLGSGVITDKMKKIFLIMLCMLLLVGSVSALEFDNIKEYDASTKTVKIKNIFGLGSDIAEVTLLTPLDVKVGQGYQKVAEFKATGFTDYKDFVKELDFYDMKNNKNKINRNYDLKMKEYEVIELNNYSNVCNDNVLQNGTIIQECSRTVSGSYFKTVEVWTKLTPADLKKNEVLTVGIFTDVQKGDKVDWIPNFAGVDVPEWATWTESLETDLLSYFEFDEGTGTIIDAHDTQNLTRSGATNTTGVIKYAYDFDGTNDYMYGTADATYDLDASFSACVWVKATSTNENRYILSRHDHNTNREWSIASGTGELRVNLGDGATTGKSYDSATLYNNGAWRQLCFTWGSSTLLLYVDGSVETSPDKTLDGTVTYADTDNPPLVVGGRLRGGAPENWFDGSVDVAGIWDRTLTATEISNLYNSGMALKYGAVATSGLSINLNSPQEYYNSSSATITFNTTVTDKQNVENVSLLIDGSIDQTNTTGYNGTYIFTKILSEGLHNWSILAHDNDTNNLSSSTRDFTVDLTSPSFNLFSPINDIVSYSLPENVLLNVSTTDNLGLSSCWYHTSDNTTNVTYSCNTPQNISFTTGGDKTINIFANDSAGNQNKTSTNFLLNYLVVDTDYTTPILETSLTTYILEINATEINSFNGTFYWNNTNYTATPSFTSTYATLTTGLTMPSVATNQVVNLSWNFNLNGINYNSSIYQQQVSNLEPLIFSSSCVDKALRFDIQDEQNLTALYGTINYNFKFGTANNPNIDEIYGTLNNVTTAYLCLNASASPYYTLGYGELQYKAENYENRRFYLFENQTISNNTLTNHTLRDLRSSEQTSFSLTFEDTSLNVYDNKYTALWRWYPNLNEYQVVEMGKTDEDGETVAHIETEDTDYRVGLYEPDGTLIKLGDPIRFLCTTNPCTFTLRVDAEDTDYTSIFGVQATLDYNISQKYFTLVYNDPSQKTSNMQLLVTRESGTNSLVICNVSSSAYTGVLTCNASAYTGIFKAVAYRSASPATVIAQKIVSTTNSIFKSGLGLFISIILWLVIVLTGLGNSPLWTIILSIIALIPALITGSINLAIFTGVAILGAIVIHFIKRAMFK